VIHLFERDARKLRHHIEGEYSSETSRSDDDILAELLQHRSIDARKLIKTFLVRTRDESEHVFEALVGLRQQDQMMASIDGIRPLRNVLGVLLIFDSGTDIFLIQTSEVAFCLLGFFLCLFDLSLGTPPGF
jgi:hypothetical protein